MSGRQVVSVYLVNVHIWVQALQHVAINVREPTQQFPHVTAVSAKIEPTLELFIGTRFPDHSLRLAISCDDLLFAKQN